MTKRFIRFAWIVAPIAFVAFPAVVAEAGDEGLYPPPPPAGSASVRVVDVRATPGRDVITVGGKSMATGVNPGRFSYVQQGPSNLKAPNFSEAVMVKAGEYYSVLVGNRKSILYKEPQPSLTQSLVVLYNLSSLQDVSLRTEDGATTLVSALRAFRVGQRTVNPLEVGFSVYAGSKKVGSVSPVQLRRGTSFGIFVFNTSGSARVVAAPGPALLD